MMKKTGIWIDKNKALIVSYENGSESFSTIESDLDGYKVTSYKSGGGATEVSKDMKFMEREKHQIRNYFKDVVNALKDSDSLVIFGPAETNERFNRALKEMDADLSKRVKAVSKTDSMTDNQVKAWVRDFYDI